MWRATDSRTGLAIAGIMSNGESEPKSRSQRGEQPRLPVRVCVGSALTLGCVVIAILVSLASPERLHAWIVVRQAWFDRSLVYHEQAYRGLESVADVMLENRRWQEEMLRVLEARRDWGRFAEVAARLKSIGARHAEWMWYGWAASLRTNDNSAGAEYLSILAEPGLVEDLQPWQREFLRGWRHCQEGRLEQARQWVGILRNMGVASDLMDLLEARVAATSESAASSPQPPLAGGGAP